MITARIETQVRRIDVPCADNRDKAVSALQDAVYKLTPEDGRCRFVVFNDGHKVYSWSYQPTFRQEKSTVKVKKESKYMLGCVVYTLLNGEDLAYENLYHDAEPFDSAAQAHRFMKERGWSKNNYRIVYEHVVEDRAGNCIYGTGLGFTKAEAKEQLNRNLEYYNIEVKKNGTIKEI